MSVSPFFDDGRVVLYHGDCRDLLDRGQVDVSVVGVVVADPPYGETSLCWDRWQTGWVDAVAGRVHRSPPPVDPLRVPLKPPPLDWLVVRRIAGHDRLDLSWLTDRACADMDAGLFFRASEALDEHPWTGAVNCCASCPVAERCLAANLDVRHGYFGRTTPDQRRTIRRLIAELEGAA